MDKWDFENLFKQLLALLYSSLGEADRRLLVGLAAYLMGRGGNVYVSKATGASKNTVTAGYRQVVSMMEGEPSSAFEQADSGDLSDDVEAENEDNLNEKEAKDSPSENQVEQEETKPIMHKTPKILSEAEDKSQGIEDEEKEAAKDAAEEEKRRQKLKTTKGVSPEKRQRKPGGGRKLAADKYPDLIPRVKAIVEKETYGDPMNELFYTTLSLRDIQTILAGEDISTRHKRKKAEERHEQDSTQAKEQPEEDSAKAEGQCEQGNVQSKASENHDGVNTETEEKPDPIFVSHTVISRVLEYLGYSKQGNRKMLQVGEPHPDRNAQFEFINATATEYLEAGDPVISIDTKKKEKLGNFTNPGKEYRKKGDPRLTDDHDFEIKVLGHVIPYGVYSVNDNTGFVNLGVDHDTPQFAGASIKSWLSHIGLASFPNAKRILITCDGGGSNGSRLWMWKKVLQEIADENDLEIQVAHYPPGTSKWNKIEHRLFCHISKNWEGQPLQDTDTVVNLIGSTRTRTGLTVKCVLDESLYPTGVKATEEDKESLNIEFLPVGGGTTAWNYIIRPRKNIPS